MADEKRRVKPPPKKVWITFDLLGGIMFVTPSARDAKADARHYGSTWAGPYEMRPAKKRSGRT